MGIKRFNDFIKENSTSIKVEDIAEILKRDCKPFLDQIRQGFVYRGTYKGIDFEKMRVRKDRRPSETPKAVQDNLDFYFNERFGFKPRSEGVFGTGDIGQTQVYGETYLFFPIGEFEFVWSSIIHDLYSYIDEYHSSTFLLDDPDVDLVELEIRNELEGKLEDIVLDLYTDENLSSAISHKNEIMFICDEYYLVNFDFEDDLRNLLS